ncbi:MAG: ATP-binding cassette domain-containing protein [Alphaproteobacteria bacterium]|nr:ATP-binding cassette domain-containing protein [Alphaproteobacteria bacterium]
MSAPPLTTIADIHLRLGDNVLFEGVDLRIGAGERACLVGRNGSGKTTLLRMLAGEIEPDSGDTFLQPGTRLAYLPQEPVLAPDQTVLEYVSAGGAASHEVDAALDQVGLDGARPLHSLSGGEGRRAGLARVLSGRPDILLLDEPTNHLDLATIEWLERTLRDYPGSVLVVSHDRTFLANVSNRTLWLDRRRLRRLDKGFAAFDSWQEDVYAAEARAVEKLDSKLAAEARWLHRGVTARRRRNQGRLRRLQDLRAVRATLIGEKARAKIAAEDGELKSRVVIDAKDLSKSFPGADQPLSIVNGFSTRILRGDRIGILGPNGAGKTTLLRLLVGDLEPDGGRVRLTKSLTVAYFDQHRAILDREQTLWQTLCPGGGDTVWVHGRPRHVVAYLKDFLFDPKQAKSPVSSLSGGERNRLLLAKILARPSELLVLDEPTNDLDMDTLERLEDMLSDYPGTLLLVSHDRNFLDRIVTGTIAMEGDGRATEYAGGYSDYLTQRKENRRGAVAFKAPKSEAAPRTRERPRRQTKLSYKDRRQLEILPGLIEAISAEIATLEDKLSDGAFYTTDREGFDGATRRLEEAIQERTKMEDRWLELETLSESLEPTG